MSSYFITGSARGLGLAMCTELARAPNSDVSYVFASARTKSTQIADLETNYPGRVIFVQLNVTDRIGCEKAANKVSAVVGDAGLDVLINNAAINQRDRADRMDDLEQTLINNVVGVRNITLALLPLIRASRGKKIVNISSAMGSTTLTKVFSNSPPSTSYKVSKAALNMLTSQWAFEFKPDGVVLLAVSPGFIKTTMGDMEGGDLTPEQSAQAVLAKVFSASMETSGHFVDIDVPGYTNPFGMPKYTGQSLPF